MKRIRSVLGFALCILSVCALRNLIEVQRLRPSEFTYSLSDYTTEFERTDCEGRKCHWSVKKIKTNASGNLVLDTFNRAWRHDQYEWVSNTTREFSTVLPAPGDVNSLYNERTNRCHEILSMNFTRLEGANIGVEFNGRMGNNMIQYTHSRAQAVKRGSGLVKIMLGNDVKFGRNLDVFSRVTWHTVIGPTLKMGSLCGGEFAQYYLYLVQHREMAKCLFSPTFLGWRPKNGLVLKPTDVVIHFRDLASEYPGTTSVCFHGIIPLPPVFWRQKSHTFFTSQRGQELTYFLHTTVLNIAFVNTGREILYPMTVEYFNSILMTIKFTKVFIVSEPTLYSHQVVKSLQLRFAADIYSDTPAGDWSLAVLAPVFIGSFGTFTWMAAFLSEGRSIHLPYVSDLSSGASWLPWHDLFIHDDPRIVYHDLVNPKAPTQEIASAVISRNTKFAHAVRERKDPCART